MNFVVLRRSAFLLLACVMPLDVSAHGSVTPDQDLCIIRIGFYKAHFKVYLPESHRHEDFCEDLPATGNSIFVMEYEHDGLADVPIDFRIIRNETGQGRFTNADHIAAIGDLEDLTVYHHAAAIQDDVFMIAHRFDTPGEFAGIVTVVRENSDEPYVAVFPFEAGYTGLGYWPWVIGGLIVLQLNYLWMSGRFSRRSGDETAPVESLQESRHA